MTMHENPNDGHVRVRFADRFALQQSWWIASEIARRNGVLWISRVSDDDIHALIIVHNGPSGQRAQFDLVGGVGWENTAGDFERLGWIDVFKADRSLDAVKHIEKGAGFGIPIEVAETNRLTIVYQLAAAILSAKLDDQSSWQIVPAPLAVSKQKAEETLAILNQFPSTAKQIDYAFSDIAETYELAKQIGKTPYWHESFWLVLKDLEPVMVLDEAGYAHLPEGVMIELLSLHHALGSNISALAGVVLMETGTALDVALLLDGK